MPALTKIILRLFLLILTVVAWPPLLEKTVSLDWQIGNMRPIAYGVQVVLVCLIVTSFVARRQIDSLYLKVFPTRKKLVFAQFAVSLSLILTLIAAEMMCRFLGLPFDDKKHWIPAENAVARFDAELGWSYIPNLSTVQVIGTEQRKVAVNIDDNGFRVRAPGVRHDPKAPTLLVIGDSYAMGHGVPYEETFAGRLESMPDFPFQVVNLGVEGYGTDQTLLILKRYFKKFNAKAVVYTYIDETIARNVNYDRRIFTRHMRVIGTKPLFALRWDGTLYLQKKPVRFDHYHYSRLWACIQVVWSRWGPKRGTRLTRALVQEMKDYLESNGAIFIVVCWFQRLNPRPTLGPGEFPFRGMDLNLIDTTAHPPPGWSTWRIPGDEHPDARAHLHVARLIAEEFQRNLAKLGNHGDR